MTDNIQNYKIIHNDSIKYFKSIFAPIDTQLQLTISKTNYTCGNLNTLTATLTDKNNNPIKDATIHFYEDNTLIGTNTTNSSGISTYDYYVQTIGQHTLNCKHNYSFTYKESTSLDSIITITKSTTSFDVTPKYRDFTNSDLMRFDGNLLNDNGVIIPSVTIKFYKDNVLLAENGSSLFVFTYQSDSVVGSYKIIFEGTSNYGSATYTYTHSD